MSYLGAYFLKGSVHAKEHIVEEYGENLSMEMLEIGQVLFVLIPVPAVWMAICQKGTSWLDLSVSSRYHVIRNKWANSASSMLKWLMPCWTLLASFYSLASFLTLYIPGWIAGYLESL